MTMMRITSEPAYILHKRPYRESSQILEVFTRNHGRFSLMSKGSRGPRSRTRGILQPFMPILVSCYGRGEMPSLRSVDTADVKPPILKGKALLSAVYINELLMIMLHRHDVHEALFADYHQVLYQVQAEADIELVLRNFEKSLLEQLGFGLNLEIDADSGEPIEAEGHYIYHVEHGPVRSNAESASPLPLLSGRSLLAFSGGRLGSAQDIAEIKRLMRHVINHHLGNRKLKSRELFRNRIRS